MGMKNIVFIFISFLLFCCQGNEVHKKQIVAKDSSITALLPLGEMPDSRVHLMARELQQFYGMKVIVMPRSAMPEEGRLKGTSRYSAPAMLAWLKRQKPANCDRILGLTHLDIYTRKGPYPHWGIFGLGYKPGVACIVSDHRLRQFGKRTDTFLTLVTLHEIGHNLGLPHCEKHPSCLMSDAKGTAKTLFAEKKWLCTNCKSMLKHP
jgi:archaemetzincin